MYYPDLKLPEDEAPHYGKYGRMRKAFLQDQSDYIPVKIPLSFFNSICVAKYCEAASV